MATVDVTAQPQSLRALDRANASRLGAAAIKHAIKAGEMTVEQALTDERAGVITVLDLLRSQPRWGYETAWRLLHAKGAEDARNRISETKRVRDLTPRQRALLAEWCS